MTRQWIIESYMVAFLDVLGQSDEVLSLSLPPSTEEELTAAVHILGDTAGYILDLREYFMGFFEARSQPTGKLDKLSPEKRELAEEMRRVEAEFRGLSDSIVISVLLTNDNEHCTPMSSIYSVLFGICGMFGISLVRGKPFRGGVDIGWGVRLTKDEVYGSALVKAVKLESKVAQYPRVVVGDSLWDYLTRVEALDSSTVLGSSAKKNAANCKTLITNDYDDHRILDVIGTGAQSIEGGIEPQWVERGYRFIVDTHERFRETEDTKHHSRYGLLRSYFESRLHLWGIQPIQPARS